jgi:Ni,Fe-hydrogenase I cytochrome b subunit
MLNPILEKITKIKDEIISYVSVKTSINPETKQCIIVYGLIIFFTLLTAVSLYNVSTDNNIVNSEKYIYAFITFMPLILLIVAAFFIGCWCFALSVSIHLEILPLENSKQSDAISSSLS